ncbi:uncharacterized protein PAF06_009717 [Gastrophryne carolinensis]
MASNQYCSYSARHVMALRRCRPVRENAADNIITYKGLKLLHALFYLLHLNANCSDKEYATSYDETMRRKAWEETWHRVQKHNQMYEQGLTKYKKAVNMFADMTSRERSSRSCLSSKQNDKNVAVQSQTMNMNLPKSVDWRESNCVSRVKNQGDYCGSCWAFATVGVVESHHCLKTKELVEFSPQQLVDCDAESDGCCGGRAESGFEYVRRNGVMRADQYRYSQKKFRCQYISKNAIKFNVTKSYILPGEDNMASSVAQDGPIAVEIDASDDLMEYSEGIFVGDCTEETNHAVIVVGYGTEHDEETGESTDYWIVKNSWGKEWGEDGYIRMERNVDLCGINSRGASVDLAQ